MQALPAEITGNAFYTFINNGPQSLANYLDRIKTANPALYNNSHQLFFNKLGSIRQSINSLKRVSTTALDILMAEHVDLCTYRLDAWLLAFVVKRLQQQRSSAAERCFSWSLWICRKFEKRYYKEELNDAQTARQF